MIVLDERLGAVAELTAPGRKTVDVGTDHSFLPAFLYLSGKTDCIIACDIGVLPLENARKTLEKYSLCDKIELRLSNGLDEIKPCEAEEIIIAGMGGTLISDILSRAQWIKASGMHLILQPMTHAEDVRKYLCENGFVIQRELALRDAGRVYIIISAFFSGDNPHSGDEAYYYVGELAGCEAPQAKTTIKKQTVRIKKRIAGLQGCGRNKEELEKLEKALEKLTREGLVE